MIETGARVPEVVKIGIELAPLAVPFLMAYTKRQKDWFKRRDGGCQFPKDGEDGKLEKCGWGLDTHVHHIYPERQAGHDGLDQDNEVDRPENGIVLCSDHHTKVIHPDMVECKSDYGRQKTLGIKKPDSFKRMFDKRQEKINKDERYWEDGYDEYFREVAQENTDRMSEPFPKRNRRGTVNRKKRRWYERFFG